MWNLKEGTVLWFRDDGTGYLKEDEIPDRSILVHYSAIAKDKRKKKCLKKGDKVLFKCKRSFMTVF